MKNPIIDNRIVNDITFARYLKLHLEHVEPNCAMGMEEVEYSERVSNRLLEYQIATCPEDEKCYHENNQKF